MKCIDQCIDQNTNIPGWCAWSLGWRGGTICTIISWNNKNVYEMNIWHNNTNISDIKYLHHKARYSSLDSVPLCYQNIRIDIAMRRPQKPHSKNLDEKMTFDMFLFNKMRSCSKARKHTNRTNCGSWSLLWTIRTAQTQDNGNIKTSILNHNFHITNPAVHAWVVLEPSGQNVLYREIN